MCRHWILFKLLSLSNSTMPKSQSPLSLSLVQQLPLEYWEVLELRCSLSATLQVFFCFFFRVVGGWCDYRHFLIWWRLRSFVMIIAEFGSVIGCRRSMDLDSPSVVWASQTAFSSLNVAFPLSNYSFYPCSLLSVSFSLFPHSPVTSLID